MSEAIGAIGGYGNVKNDELLKLKEEELLKGKKLGWCNGFNINQLGSLLNGSLGTTASQG